MKKISLVCFDLDGVLVDACDIHKKALEIAMVDILGYTISEEDHLTKFNGLPTRKKLELLGVSKTNIEKVNALKQELTIQLVNSSISPEFSKINLLSAILDKNIPIVCVTNSIRNTSELMLRKAGIYPLFIDTIISNEDVVLPKPSPEGYTKAMKLFNVPPKETLIIEDSDFGIEAAVKSGANVIRVESPKQVTYDLVKDYL